MVVEINSGAIVSSSTFCEAGSRTRGERRMAIRAQASSHKEVNTQPARAPRTPNPRTTSSTINAGLTIHRIARAAARTRNRPSPIRAYRCASTRAASGRSSEKRRTSAGNQDRQERARWCPPPSRRAAPAPSPVQRECGAMPRIRDENSGWNRALHGEPGRERRHDPSRKTISDAASA